MPELPEVETTRRGIEPHLIGQRIRQIRVHNPRLRWPIPADLPRRAREQPVLRVERRAKYLLMRLPEISLLWHLGMSGSLRLSQADEALKLHDHVELMTDGGKLLRFHDPRRFGTLLWFPGQDLDHPLLSQLGPEPLEAGFDGDYLARKAQGRRTTVKAFLMDARIVVGVGNIYANEALFRAGIRPDRAAGRISPARYRQLADAVRHTLGEAIRQGGSTLRDFVNGNGEPGYFQQTLHVYGRAGLPCTGCGRILTEIRLSGRSTVFCAHCQR